MLSSLKSRVGGLLGWLGWRAAATALGAALAAGAIHWWLASSLEHEQEKASYLRGEVARLDKDIAEVNRLRNEIAALLARKQVAETLQRDRLWAARLFDQLARRRPEGIALRAVREEGAALHLSGVAASHGAVARLIDNLQASPLFGRPQLLEVRSEGGAAGAIRFALSVPIRGRSADAQAVAPRAVSAAHTGDPK